MYTTVSSTVRPASSSMPVTSEPNFATMTSAANSSTTRPGVLKPLNPLPGGRSKYSSQRRTANGEPISAPKLPLFVRLLLLVQHASSLVAVSAIAIVLGVYATSVYAQRAWNREYRQLRELQHQERNLVAASESLRYHLAEQADKSQTHLVPTDPGTTIYLPAVAPLPPQTEPPETPVPSLRPQIQSPLAY